MISFLSIISFASVLLSIAVQAVKKCFHTPIPKNLVEFGSAGRINREIIVRRIPKRASDLNWRLRICWRNVYNMRIVLSTAGYRRTAGSAGYCWQYCRYCWNCWLPPGPRDTHCICILAHLGDEIALALAIDSIHSESSLEPLLWTSIFRPFFYILRSAGK